MSISPEPNKRYTYKDYLSWDHSDERWELIDGIPFNMAPSPSTKHQSISRELTVHLTTTLRDQHCDVFSAPFDVVFSDHDIVQPDISVVCDKNQLDEKGCKGAPDLIIEILSPSTAKKDKLYKFNLYQRFGVKEYWIVDPLHEYIEVFILNEGVYSERKVYGKEDDIELSIKEGIMIHINDIFSRI